MVRDVGSPVLSIHLDTFHMNIEEKDRGRRPPFSVAGKHLGHFHACGCDRGQPGRDHINWTAIAGALKQIGYQGVKETWSPVIESFTPDVKVIAKAAAIWRQVEPNQAGRA